MKNVTKDMLISDILAVDNRVAAILMQHGMHCVGCKAAQYESLEEACQVHGISPEDCDKLIDTINGFLTSAVEA